MTHLALWLLTVGICDLMRARRDRVETRDVLLITGLAMVLLLALAVAADPAGWRAWALTAVSAVGIGVWIFASAAALNHQGKRGGTLDRRVALGALVASVLILLALGGRAPMGGGLMQRWYDGLAIQALQAVQLETFLLAGGLLVFQLSSANIVVRMVLDGVGTPAASAEKTLKGGRLLGPLERVFILGLGMAGHVTAASIVIAAKGLLRFPELQDRSDPPMSREARGEVSEYFLVGSFVSWLIAMAGLPLL